MENDAESLRSAVDNARCGLWPEAAIDLLSGQVDHGGAVKLYLQYFPEAIRYAASKVGVVVEIDNPELIDG